MKFKWNDTVINRCTHTLSILQYFTVTDHRCKHSEYGIEKLLAGGGCMDDKRNVCIVLSSSFSDCISSLFIYKTVQFDRYCPIHLLCHHHRRLPPIPLIVYAIHLWTPIGFSSILHWYVRNQYDQYRNGTPIVYFHHFEQMQKKLLIHSMDWMITC